MLPTCAQKGTARPCGNLCHCEDVQICELPGALNEYELISVLEELIN